MWINHRRPLLPRLLLGTPPASSSIPSVSPWRRSVSSSPAARSQYPSEAAFPGRTGWVAAMPDGQRFLSGGGFGDGTVRVWLLDGTLKNTFFGLHIQSVIALVALPDNQHALSGSFDKTVKLFNVNDGAVLRTFTHHTNCVNCLALLPDGLRFVSGSYDNTARIVEIGRL